MDERRWRIRLSEAAERDFAAILEWTLPAMSQRRIRARRNPRWGSDGLACVIAPPANPGAPPFLRAAHICAVDFGHMAVDELRRAFADVRVRDYRAGFLYVVVARKQ